MNIRGIFRKTSPMTEKEAGDEQTTFGSQGASVDDWLASTYEVGSPRQRRFQFIAETFLPGDPKLVLEIGAGLGDFSVYCSTIAPQHTYTVSDLTEGKFEKYFQKVRDFFKSQHPFAIASFEAEHIPYPDTMFNLVFIRSAVHHLDDPVRAFAEIYRVLKPEGKIVFFHDPVALDIPIVREIWKRIYASDARALGYNEHIYMVREYLSFGNAFRERSANLDMVYQDEFRIHSQKWRGIKGSIGKFLSQHPRLLSMFFIYEYGMPYYFVFSK